MATAVNDLVAPDYRFLRINRDQRVYVYSKLLPVEGADVFRSGSVCVKFRSDPLQYSTGIAAMYVPHRFCSRLHA